MKSDVLFFPKTLTILIHLLTKVMFMFPTNKDAMYESVRGFLDKMFSYQTLYSEKSYNPLPPPLFSISFRNVFSKLQTL